MRGQTVLIWPDTHAPYHSPEAVAVVSSLAKAIKPTTIAVIGDLEDCWLVSEYPKVFRDQPRHKTIFAEQQASKSVIRTLDRLPGNKEFLEGNHEFRYDRYLAAHPELEGLVLRLRERLPTTWKSLPYKRSLRIGKLSISHDFGRCGVNSSRQGILDLGTNLAFGHTHKLACAYVANHVALNAGWLGDVELIDYLHIDRARREYQLGFGLVDIDEQGNVWPQAVAIVGKPGSYRAVVRGKRIGS